MIQSTSIPLCYFFPRCDPIHPTQCNDIPCRGERIVIAHATMIRFFLHFCGLVMLISFFPTYNIHEILVNLCGFDKHSFFTFWPFFRTSCLWWCHRVILFNLILSTNFITIRKPIVSFNQCPYHHKNVIITTFFSLLADIELLQLS